MNQLDLNDPNTLRRLRAGYHGIGCNSEHGIADCPHPDDIIDTVDDFVIGLRAIGDVIDVDALNDERLLEAWHTGCNRIGREHTFAECDEPLRKIMSDEVREDIRPMLEMVSF